MFREAEVFTLSGLSVHFDRNTHPVHHYNNDNVEHYDRCNQKV